MPFENYSRRHIVVAKNPSRKPKKSHRRTFSQHQRELYHWEKIWGYSEGCECKACVITNAHRCWHKNIIERRSPDYIPF